MVQSSRAESAPSSREILEAQLRECFGRVVYTHKTHEKCSDILLGRLATIKLTQIVLSSVTTVGFLVLLFGATQIGTFLGLFVSAVLLILNTYTKDFDLGELAQKHRQSAVDIWLVREDFLSLISDLRTSRGSIERIAERRDELTRRLYGIYSGAPSTSVKAYKKAQAALQTQEDMTFSDEEINSFLPSTLHK